MPAKPKRNPRSVSDEDKLIGQRIKLRRTELNMSQAALGGSLNPPITFQQVQKYEQGVNRVACATAIQISRLLKMDLNELLGVKSVVREVAIDPIAYELGLELQKMSPRLRPVLLRFARALVGRGHGVR